MSDYIVNPIKKVSEFTYQLAPGTFLGRAPVKWKTLHFKYFWQVKIIFKFCRTEIFCHTDSLNQTQTNKLFLKIVDFHNVHTTQVKGCLSNHASDVDFVTNITSGICVIYFWARVKLSRINAKIQIL